MTESAPGRKTSVLRKESTCFICGAKLPVGTEVEWHLATVRRRGRFDGQEQAALVNRPIHVGRSDGCKAAKALAQTEGAKQ